MVWVRRSLQKVRAGLMAGVCLGAAAAAHAEDATWSAAPPNNNWNDGANWTSIPPHTVPDGTASFGESTQKSIVFSSNFTSIGNLNFSATAPAYTYTIVAGQGFVVLGTGTVDLQGAGGGIVNNSSFAPTFVLTGALAGMSFNNFATAANANFNITGGGNLQFFNNARAAASITNSSGGSTSFFNNSSASSPIKPGQAVVGSTIVNNSGGTTSFFDTSNAFGAFITNNDGGSTKFFNSSTAFSATITNNNNGATVFGSPFGSDIASAGDFTTIINNSGGKTDFNASSTAGKATITNSGGATNFNDTSMAANATIDNAGGTTIFGVNTKAGSANITNRQGGLTLIFGNAGSATITNEINGQTGFAFSGMAGTASIVNTGGATQFTASSTADHATITNSNSGNTSFFGSSMAGSASITNEKNAATLFADTSTADNATILNKLGGVVVFKNNSTAGNATITNDGGATTFVDNSCVGTATITAINGGFISYAQSGPCPTPGPKPKVIVGQGSKIDISGLLLPGITFGSIEGLGTIILGSKALTVGTNDLSTEFAGVIADGGAGGSLVKIGNGTLILSGADTYTGPTNVNAGILNVNGSLVSTVFVNAGGTLMGNGFIGGLVVGSGATVAPGNSIGTLTVNGNVNFLPGSFYQVEANAAGQSDKIVATGTATLAGGTVQVLAENQAYARQTRYTILTANGGVIGTFAGVTSNLAFLTPTLSYDPNDVFLTLNRNDITFASVAQTPNQRAVAGALDRSPLFSPLVQAVVNLTGASALRAFDALSGEVHGSLQTTIVDDSRYIRQAVLGRLRQAPYASGTGALAALGTGGPMLAYADSFAPADSVLGYADSKKSAFPIKAPPLAAPVQTPDLTFWAQGVGAWGKIDSDGNAADVSRNLAGFFTGFDRRFGEWRLGAAAGYTNSSLSVSARASSANIDTAYLAAYAGTGFGAWNFRSGATFAWNTIGTSRSIVFPGFAEQASARYGAGESQVFGELGYGMTFGAIAAEPFAGLAWVHLDTRSFTETGGVSALTGTGNRDDVGYSTLGLRAATYYLLQNGMALIPRASVAWQHAFGAVTPTAALAFQSAGAGFGIAGVPLARDAALIEAGGDLQLTTQAKVGVSYAGQLANSAHDHSVKGNFTWRF